MQSVELQQDPFVIGLKERLPEDLQNSFTPEQLAALKVAFGARSWGRHKVDLRGTLRFGRWRYYFVFLAGRNRRDLSRLERDLSRGAKAMMLSLVLLGLLLAGLGLLYLIKSALGIDIFPGFSLGIWDWFRSA
ncbi:3-phosphoshikimate 1-carboxyvinyltransferase [Stutzerimonas tarimensis]|uniref:3-phosphoshikimate 1-carboxyvinyltransferase n=1 Tax=Stutzerimonas tarimensis TaxID=1507735 RepID=A0ABV7T8N8_9GAMM